MSPGYGFLSLKCRRSGTNSGKDVEDKGEGSTESFILLNRSEANTTAKAWKCDCIGQRLGCFVPWCQGGAVRLAMANSDRGASGIGTTRLQQVFGCAQLPWRVSTWLNPEQDKIFPCFPTQSFGHSQWASFFLSWSLKERKSWLTAVTHGRQCAFYWGSFVDSELHTFVDPLVAWTWDSKQSQVLLTIGFVQITIQTGRGLEHWPNNTHQEHEVGRGCRIRVSWGGHLQGHSSQWVSCHQCTFTWTSFVDSRSYSIYTKFLLQIEVVTLWFTIFHLMVILD